MFKEESPNWLTRLDQEDIEFIKRFMLCSGSLKDLAQEFGITYPTMRIRLDKVISKIRIYDSLENDDFVDVVKTLVNENRIDFETSRLLISEYKKSKRR
ncbi:DUF2089 family protein [Faecalibacillus faecis]|uniref:DUF2089 family protein n=1 Tax=Faecalibacillus faecis TaxID=1982628 RepID=UPI00386E83FA